MEIFPIYCGGEFVKTNNTIDVVNPFTQKVFAKACLADAENLETAITKAQSVASVMKYLPAFEKSKALNQIADQLEIHKHTFSLLLSNESAKPMKYATGEVNRAIQTFRVAAEESRRLPGEFLDIDWTPAGEGKEAWVKHFPVGLVAGISPFNFPLNLAVHKIAPAIAAGCPLVLKPSSSTPLSTLKLAEIIDKTDLPKGAVSILPMNRETGNRLVTDDRFKLLSFTGSPVVGWKMKANAGKKKVVLELGGNAGVIVGESADMDLAIPKCITGAFAYSGQVCIHAQRFYVHESIFDEFTEKFTAATKALKVGDPEDGETDISAMIDEDNAIRVESWVHEAVEDGAKVLLGGKREAGYYPPTILTQTKPAMKVCALEVFGPVVTLEPFTDFGEALKQINGSKYGLQAGLFSNSIDEMDKAFATLDAGGVIINDVPTFRVDHMPYGGVKESGLGREGVKYAILDMLEARILVKNKFTG